MDRDVVGLVAMEPAQREQYRRVQWRFERLPVDRRRRCRIDEIGNVSRPLPGPALPQEVLDDIRRVADQVIAAAIVFELVVAAEPADLNRPPTRAISRIRAWSSKPPTKL